MSGILDLPHFAVNGPPFECDRSCGNILQKGDVSYLVDGRMVCPQCAAHG